LLQSKAAACHKTHVVIKSNFVGRQRFLAPNFFAFLVVLLSRQLESTALGQALLGDPFQVF
jgi:hypothetical protein